MSRSQQLPSGFVQTLLYVCRQLLSKRRRGNKQPLTYFVPDQIVLLAEHEAGLEPQEIARLSSKEIARYREGADQRVLAVLDNLIGRLQELPPQDEEKPQAVVSFAQAVEQPFSLVTVSVQGTSNELLIRAFDYLNRRIINDRDATGPFRLTAASPNWAAGAAQTHIIRGGPGARPVHPNGMSRADATGTTGDYRMTLPQEIQNNLDAQRGEADEPVTVAILDTATPLATFEQAFGKPWFPSHPLLSSLLGPNGLPNSGGPLNITYAQQIGIVFPTDNQGHLYAIRNQEYNMADHGLFSAGIIHSLAPAATLHLIEVLNEYGVGTLLSLAQGLNWLERQRDIKHLVINCSLTLTVPLPGHSREDLPWDTLEIDCELIRRMGLAAQKICDAFAAKYGDNVRVVAAAGNDATGRSRPQARFPASLLGVVGVGALDRAFKPTNYSNLSDTPLRMGIATFGGVEKNGQADATDGMLGVYLNNFPDNSPSSGWARWAGTSFAAPIISGVIALLVNKRVAGNAAAAEDMIRTLPTDMRTSEGEDIFPVRQGP